MISFILLMGNLRLGMAKETQLKSWELGLKLKLSLKSKSVSICPSFHSYMAFPGGTSGKEPACQCRRHKRRGFDPWVGTIPWRRKWQPTPVFLAGESHGQRSLKGYSPQSCKSTHLSSIHHPSIIHPFTHLPIHLSIIHPFIHSSICSSLANIYLHLYSWCYIEY